MSKVYYLSELHSHNPLDFLYGVEAYDFSDEEIMDMLDEHFGHRYNLEELRQVMKQYRKEIYYGSKTY